MPAAKRFVISRRTRRSRGRVAPVVVSCKQASACRGTVRLVAKFRQRVGPAKGTSRRIRIGQRRFRVAPGKRAALRVKLNARGRRLLRNRRTARVVAAARLAPQAFTSSGTVTIRASYRLLSSSARR